MMKIIVNSNKQFQMLTVIYRIKHFVLWNLVILCNLMRINVRFYISEKYEKY